MRVVCSTQQNMKVRQDTNGHESLAQALRVWHVEEPLPPRFQEQVWLRIERAEAVTAANFLKQFSAWFGRAFSRPSVAVTYAAVLLAGGLLAGYYQAHVEKTRTVENLSSRYVQMIDPYLARH
jgi:hypothetical protein